ncbi:hypothetical protein HELRODRAFT_162619 [Helobdella robusta]|uniref:Motile sperm domain-containing protein 3 n=1 Tax=Helobdella robusta TaxID=6412 RepID=T1ESX5_HELRO|nr:hypothetical protein HELRODRAFT_162619 [Helobdella robusta]ESN99125.1 hypothetical protein HELRODRAFT_162619 [Helobdella robusta]
MNKNTYPVDKSAEMQLPVFTNHNSLSFYSDDSSSHQQLIKLYNPYSFNIKYKILSTAREKYKVYNPEGCIKAGCSIDLIFKHLAAVGCKENVSDRFRIQVMKQGSSKIIGKKELESVLMPTALKQPNFYQLDDDFQSLPNVQSTNSSVSFTGNALWYNFFLYTLLFFTIIQQNHVTMAYA